MTEKFNESIKFVAEHYRKGAFQPVMRFAPLSFWQRRGTVAACIAAGLLVASACVYFLIPTSNTTKSVHTEQPTVIEVTQTQVSELEVKSMEFTDATLAEVVEAIEQTYNVKVEGLEADSDIRLTLRYEGTAIDLVETINELEGTELTIAE